MQLKLEESVMELNNSSFIFDEVSVNVLEFILMSQDFIDNSTKKNSFGFKKSNQSFLNSVYL